MKRESIINKNWRKRNPEKSLAHSKINNAVKSGNIKRLDCYNCGNHKSEAHHEDYSKPLEVVWLCRICHVKAHTPIKKIKPQKSQKINDRVRKSKTSYSLFNEIKELKNRGFNYRQIGEYLNLSKSQVYKIYNTTKYH